jgi:hypothetical protein
MPIPCNLKLVENAFGQTQERPDECLWHLSEIFMTVLYLLQDKIC